MIIRVSKMVLVGCELCYLTVDQRKLANHKGLLQSGPRRTGRSCQLDPACLHRRLLLLFLAFAFPSFILPRSLTAKHNHASWNINKKAAECKLLTKTSPHTHPPVLLSFFPVSAHPISSFCEWMPRFSAHSLLLGHLKCR